MLVFRYRIGLLIAVVLISITVCTFAQDQQIAGTIISSNIKEPLSAVNVRILGSTTGTISNDEGRFSLKFTESYTIKDSVIFSCLGYQTQKIAIAEALKRKNIVVELHEFVEQLKEVVVRPLTLKQLLDSINIHNQKAFVSPVKLNGYYREFVYTNAKCTEYSDALFEYYFNNGTKNSGQLKINASRCEKAVKKDQDKNNYEAYMDSKLNPDRIFGYATLSDMLKDRFSDNLADYEYKMEEGTDAKRNIKVVIAPKATSPELYTLTFYLSNDFSLQLYKLEITPERLKMAKERSLLGLHSKIVAFSLEVKYQEGKRGIYPNSLRITKSGSVIGKMLGVTVNQVSEQRSEFVITQVNTNDVNPFDKKEVYKKGNICNNGVAMNTDLLKSYNFILPTKKDSLAISSINKDLPVN